jgi:Holliday junction resolvasome RuvABC endonuclease subunit
MTRILAFDLSLNHGGVVELTNGEMSWCSFYTDHARTAQTKLDAKRIAMPKTADKQYAQMHRLAQIEEWFVHVMRERRPQYVGIEGYAYHMQQGAHQLGEAGGAARIWCWKFGVRFRLHDPTSIKMYVTHDGTAQKDLIEHCVHERWGHDFSRYNPPSSKAGKENRRTSEDLADAYGMARLVDCEIKLRSGACGMKDLEHDKERQVFNRVTKTFPVSLLGREWIHNPSGSFDAPRSPGLRKTRTSREVLTRLVRDHREVFLELIDAVP